jgi:hypothetical protein
MPSHRLRDYDAVLKRDPDRGIAEEFARYYGAG